MTLLQKYRRIIEYSSLIIGYIIAVIFYFSVQEIEIYNKLLIVNIIVMGANVLFCLFNYRKRFLTLIFYGMIFLFLLSYPVFSPMKNNLWYYVGSVNANIIALSTIVLSLLCINIGVVVSEYIQSKNKKTEKQEKQEKNIGTYRKIMGIILIICMSVLFVQEIDKYFVMQGYTYEDYYIVYKTRLPYILTIIAGLTKYALCIYLALKPSKKMSIFTLIIYVASAIPMTLIGSRKGIILNILFFVVYFLLRDSLEIDYSQKWIRKKEKILVVIMIPLIIGGAGIIDMLRGDKSVDDNFSVVDLASDFFYGQGTTYKTILQSIVHQDELIQKDSQFYTLAPITDYIFYGTIGQKLFGTNDLGYGNNINKVYYGANLSHDISYEVYVDKYFEGNGRGSSYIAELYLDFGYIGVAFFSIFIGCFLSFSYEIAKKHWLFFAFLLLSFLTIYFMPRDSALNSIMFIFEIQFWIVLSSLFICKYIIEYLQSIINKKNILGKLIHWF